MSNSIIELSHCLFCSKDSNKVKKILSRNNLSICNECITSFFQKLDSDIENLYTNSKNDLNPKEIFSILNTHIIGQEKAKKSLAVTVYNHYKKFSENKAGDSEIRKSNVLMIGPTGCGKTLLVQILSQILDVPFAITDATTLTEAGYVGEDVENILVRLLENADYDIEKTEKGIIYIDEIDKISKKSENVSITRDVSGEGVQQSLLKLMEGTIALVPPKGGRKHPSQNFLKVNTNNILFICGGAFSGLTDIVDYRKKINSVGFENIISKQDIKPDATSILNEVEPRDLIKYGLIPEFVGRLPKLILMKDLDKNMLVRILKEPKNSLVKEYQKIFKMNGITLDFDNQSLRMIADIAFKKGLGARGLRSIMEDILLDMMFEFSNNNIEKRVLIDLNFVRSKLQNTRDIIALSKNNK